MREMCHEPLGASGGETGINLRFFERKTRDDGLVENRAGVHFRGEAHDRITEFGIAGENGAFDRRRATVLRQERGMEVEDAFGGEKLEQVGFDQDAERGEDAMGGGILGFLADDFGQIGLRAGVE